MKTDQVYQELDDSKMYDNVITSNVYENLNTRKIDPLNDEVINKKDYQGMDASIIYIRSSYLSILCNIYIIIIIIIT